MAAQKTLRLQRRPPAVFPMEGKDALLSRPWKQRQSADEIVPERGGYTALPWQALAGYYMSLNCRPARRLCWPVIGWQKRGYARGNGGAIRNAGLRMREPVCAALSFYRCVLRSNHIGHAFLLECLASGSRLLFAAQRQTERLAIRCVSIPRGSGSP